LDLDNIEEVKTEEYKIKIEDLLTQNCKSLSGNCEQSIKRKKKEKQSSEEKQEKDNNRKEIHRDRNKNIEERCKKLEKN